VLKNILLKIKKIKWCVLAKKLPFFHTKSQTGKKVPFLFCQFFAEKNLISEFLGR